MVKQLIEILHSDDFKDGDEIIHFAKGSNKGVNLKDIRKWLKI